MKLDNYMDDFGRDLNRAATKKTRRRRRTRLVVALPAAAALAAVGVIALPHGGGIDAIAEAREALAPGDEIVHMTIQFKSQQPGGYQQPATEQWYAAEPNRWKTRVELPKRTKGAPFMTDRHGQVFGVMEQVFSGDRMRLYFAQRDVVTIYRGVKLPAGFTGPSVSGGDPVTELRTQLNAGDVRDDGVVTHDGKQVRRLVRETKPNGKGELRQRFVYYMDPQTFTPLGGRMYFAGRGSRLIGGPEFTITGYERIPLNAETEKLLKVDKTPNTKFVWKDIKRR